MRTCTTLSFMSITSTGLVGWGSGKVRVVGPAASCASSRRTYSEAVGDHLAYADVVRARGRRRAPEPDLRLLAELGPLAGKPPTLGRRRPVPATSGSNSGRRRGPVRHPCKSRSDLLVNHVYGWSARPLRPDANRLSSAGTGDPHSVLFTVRSFYPELHRNCPAGQGSGRLRCRGFQNSPKPWSLRECRLAPQGRRIRSRSTSKH